MQKKERETSCWWRACVQVEKERQKDAAEGVEIAQLLEGFVRRKVSSQHNLSLTLFQWRSGQNCWQGIFVRLYAWIAMIDSVWYIGMGEGVCQQRSLLKHVQWLHTPQCAIDNADTSGQWQCSKLCWELVWFRNSITKAGRGVVPLVVIVYSVDYIMVQIPVLCNGCQASTCQECVAEKEKKQK